MTKKICPTCKQIIKLTRGRPRLFTEAQKKQIREDRQTLSLQKACIKWRCSQATIINITAKKS